MANGYVNKTNDTTFCKTCTESLRNLLVKDAMSSVIRWLGFSMGGVQIGKGEGQDGGGMDL